MKLLTCTILAATTAAVGVIVASPMSASAGPIRDRMVNQQQRVYHGVQNGTISGAEYRKLERREASVALQRAYYSQTRGGLQPWEKARLNNRLDNISRSIYRDKHD
jgi:surface antigen